MKTNEALRWKIRQTFWARWQALRSWAARPRTIGQPHCTATPIELIPFKQKYPDIPLENFLICDELPDKNAARPMRWLVGLGLWLERHLLSQMQKGLPEIDADIDTALKKALRKMYIDAFRAPRRPGVFEKQDVPDLGELAVRSPLTIFVERTAGTEYVWDFEFLNDFEHHDGLRRTGVKVFFSDQQQSKTLKATRIISAEFQDVVPGDEYWDDSVKLAICAATTHLALTRHFNYVHLISGNHWEVSARKHLSIGDPIYHLLWPHIYNSCYTNEGVTRVQMMPDGDFANMFSFTHHGLMKYFDAMYERYQWQVMNPELDWQRRGLGEVEATASDWPFHHNMRELYEVMHDHALRYVEAYYASDADLRADDAINAWLTELNGIIPNGIGEELVGAPTREALAELIGAYLFEGSTVHDLAGTHMWDYQLWADKCPTRIYRNGQRLPLDVYQRVINNNFSLQLERTPLLDNYSGAAMDDTGRELFTRFAIDCRQLQVKYDLGRWSEADSGDESSWRLEPRNLEISMNG